MDRSRYWARKAKPAEGRKLVRDGWEGADGTARGVGLCGIEGGRRNG